MIDVSDTLLLSFTGLAAELLEETAIAAWMLKSSVSEIGYCSIIPTATDGVHVCTTLSAGAVSSYGPIVTVEVDGVDVCT
jgi:hypothetical protein